MAVCPGTVLLAAPCEFFLRWLYTPITSAHPSLSPQRQGFFDDKFPSVKRFIPAHMVNRGNDDEDDEEQDY